MFILTPLIIIFASAVAILYTAWRKLPYLKKLTPESYPTMSEFLWGFIPEVKQTYSKLNWKEYQANLLLEVEKFLRRSRLFFLKIDTWSDRLIKRIRKSNLPHAINATVAEVSEPVKVKAKKVRKPTEEELRKEEQDLIISIAKNPKDVTLYAALGEVYLKMDNLEDAREAFKAALKFDSENEPLKKKLERLETKLGHLST